MLETSNMSDDSDTPTTETLAEMILKLQANQMVLNQKQDLNAIKFEYEMRANNEAIARVGGLSRTIPYTIPEEVLDDIDNTQECSPELKDQCMQQWLSDNWDGLQNPSDRVNIEVFALVLGSIPDAAEVLQRTIRAHNNLCYSKMQRLRTYMPVKDQDKLFKEYEKSIVHLSDFLVLEYELKEILRRKVAAQIRGEYLREAKYGIEKLEQELPAMPESIRETTNEKIEVIKKIIEIMPEDHGQVACLLIQELSNNIDFEKITLPIWSDLD